MPSVPSQGGSDAVSLSLFANNDDDINYVNWNLHLDNSTGGLLMEACRGSSEAMLGGSQMRHLAIMLLGRCTQVAILQNCHPFLSLFLVLGLWAKITSQLSSDYFCVPFQSADSTFLWVLLFP